MGKIHERVLEGDGSFKSFPQRERAKAEKKGLVAPLPPEPDKEPNTSPRGALKKKLNKQAKKNNEAAMKKQKKKENEQRLAGN